MSRPIRLPANRMTRILLALVVLGLAAAAGLLIYLRYFYGDDAPPPFELSSVALLLPQRRRSGSMRSTARRALAVASVAAVSLVGATTSSNAATKTAKAPKVGASCTKVGATSTSGTTKLTCTVVAKKKRWAATKATVSTPTSAAATASTPTTTSAGAAPSAGIEGTYAIGSGSAAGYRVRELFVGGLAKVDAVGRSEAVTGTVVLGRNGSTLQLQSVNATVDMTKLVSDESRRDGRMRTTGIETDKFPTATFVSSAVVPLDADSESGKPVKATVAGKLTLHGVTRDVQIPVDAQLRSGTLEIVGRLAINLKDYAIDPPEIADFVKADDDGAFEFKLVLKKG